MSSQGDPVCCAVFGLFVGIGMFIDGLRKYREKQYILGTPTSSVRGAAVGFAELTGKAEAIETGESVVGAKQAITHKWILERWERRGKHSDWVTIKDWDRRPQFYLNDGTGKLLIDPNGADIEIPLDFEWKGKQGSAPDGVKKLIPASGGFFGGPDYRFREWFISPGDTIYAIGTVQDRPGEYEKGYENLVMAQNRGPGPKFFFISDSGEKTILDRYYGATGIWLKIAGGIVIFGISLAYVLLRLGGFG